MAQNFATNISFKWINSEFCKYLISLSTLLTLPDPRGIWSLLLYFFLQPAEPHLLPLVLEVVVVPQMRTMLVWYAYCLQLCIQVSVQSEHCWVCSCNLYNSWVLPANTPVSYTCPAWSNLFLSQTFYAVQAWLCWTLAGGQNWGKTGLWCQGRPPPSLLPWRDFGHEWKTLMIFFRNNLCLYGSNSSGAEGFLSQGWVI